MLAVSSVLSGASPAAAQPAGSDSDEAAFLTMANRDRVARRLPPLASAPDLVGIARNQAATMATENRLFHNPFLKEQVQDWQAVGENVGRGPTADDIHRAFMASTSHREEILSPRFTEIGVGVTRSGGVVWVSEVFRMRASAAAAPPPAPSSGSTAASAAPSPAPTAPPPASSPPTTAAVPRPAHARTPAARGPARADTAPADNVPAAPPPAPIPAEPVEDPLARALAAAVAAAAGTRPAPEAGAVDAGVVPVVAVSETSPALPPLPVAVAWALLACVVVAQLRVARRLRPPDGRGAA